MKIPTTFAARCALLVLGTTPAMAQNPFDFTVGPGQTYATIQDAICAIPTDPNLATTITGIIRLDPAGAPYLGFSVRRDASDNPLDLTVLPLSGADRVILESGFLFPCGGAPQQLDVTVDLEGEDPTRTTVRMEGLIIDRGSAPSSTDGGIAAEGVVLEMKNCEVRNATDSGLNVDKAFGSLPADPVTQVVLRDCIFRDNEATRGAAISQGFQEGTNVVAIRTIFLSNEAQNGGAIGISGGFAEDTRRNILTLDQCRFEDNRACTAGGAIYVQDNNSVFATETSFVANLCGDVIGEVDCTGDGGAVWLTGAQDADFEHCVFDANLAQSAGEGRGGAFFANGQNAIDLNNCLVVNNASNGGGGFFLQNAQLNLDNCTVADNSGGFGFGGLGGAAVFDATSTILLKESIVWNNSLPAFGGTGTLSTTPLNLVQQVDPAGPLFATGRGATFPGSRFLNDASGSPETSAVFVARDYYLSSGSPAVDPSGGVLPLQCLQLCDRTTSVADDFADENTDLGYHYPTPPFGTHSPFAVNPGNEVYEVPVGTSADIVLRLGPPTADHDSTQARTYVFIPAWNTNPMTMTFNGLQLPFTFDFANFSNLITLFDPIWAGPVPNFTTNPNGIVDVRMNVPLLAGLIGTPFYVTGWALEVHQGPSGPTLVDVGPNDDPTLNRLELLLTL